MPVDFSSIEVLARLSDVEIDTREICDKWLLLTYDIPQSEKGNKARRRFLQTAKLIGATRHTDSVYLMPWTSAAEGLALQLAKAGEVCVWTSQTTDEGKAQEITKSYDRGLVPILDEVVERIDKIDDHLNKKHFKLADKMMTKTEKMLAGIKQAIIRRGSAELFIYLTTIERRFNALLP